MVKEPYDIAEDGSAILHIENKENRLVCDECVKKKAPGLAQLVVNKNYTYEEYAMLFETQQGKDARFRAAAEILQNFNIKTHTDSKTIYIFNNKYYEPTGESIIKQEVQTRFGKHNSTHNTQEVIGHIKRSTLTPEGNFDQPVTWLCLENGILDLDTFELKPHTPEFLCRNYLPIKYNPNVDCPHILQFMEEVLIEKDKAIIQELFGYCLIREYFVQKAFMFLGDGSNGKSTLLNLLEAFLGARNVSHMSLQELNTNKFAASQLIGKLANIHNDLSSRALSQTGTFKSLTGGDAIYVEKKYKEGFSYKNYAKLVFACNQLPETKDDTNAFFRRWVFVSFPNSFTGNKADKQLIKKLTTPEEFSGLLNYAIIGLKRLLEQDDFSKTETTEIVRMKYIKLSSPIAAFVIGCLEHVPDDIITKEDMYAAFIRYCKRDGLPTVDKNIFGRKVSQHAEGIRSTQVTIENKRTHAWRGYRFKEESANVSEPQQRL